MMQIAPVVVTQTTQQSNSGNSMRDAIPSLPVPLAIIYGILNFIFPGLGTILAGFSVLCCGNTGQSEGGRVGTFCINFWVGILQLVTVVIFLLGWIWSIIWGIAIMSLAGDQQPATTSTTTTTVIPGYVAPPPPVVSTTVVNVR